MSKNENKNQNEKTVLRKKLEELKDEIYKGWVKDTEKIKEMAELSALLDTICNKNTIEEVFENQSDFTYFIGEFTSDTLSTILKQGVVFGTNGDEVALNVLVLYVRIFYKFMDKPQYQPLWDSIREIFDSSKLYYKGSIHKILNPKKMTTAEQYNETSLTRKVVTSLEINEGMEIDVLVSNSRGKMTANLEKKVWVRGKVCNVTSENFSVLTAEETLPVVLKYTSFEYAPLGTMTKDWDWRQNLQVDDCVDCFDRAKWYPGTISEKKVDIVNGIQRIEYKVTFKIFPHLVPNWKDYCKFWPGHELMKDSKQREFLGDHDNFDELMPSFAKKLQPFNTMAFTDMKKLDTFESENYFIDDMVNFIDDKGHKVYVIGRTNNFSYYFAVLLNIFAEMEGFEKMIGCLSKKGDERPAPDLIHVIFDILNSVSGFFHKEYVIELGKTISESIFNYLNEMSQNELRNLKREALELIEKVLRFYLGLSLGVEKRNEILEKFSLGFAVKMIKTTFLDKRASGIKNIIDIIRSAKNNPEKTKMMLDIVEEHKILYEIYGPNSHIQLISRSKDLLEMILEADKLSDEEMEMIWNATKKGDLEGKLTIIRTLKEISKALKPNHIKALLENIYGSKSSELLNDEIDLIYELSTSMGGDETLDQCIKFFTMCLLESTTDEGERIDTLISKIFEITKLNQAFKASVIQMTLSSLEKNENTVLALKVLAKFLKESNLETEVDLNQILVANDNLVSLYLKSFEDYLAFVKEKVKSWNQDIDQLALKDNFSHSQNIKSRLHFLNSLLESKLWKIQVDPVDFVYKSLIEDGLICGKDEQQFYWWIKSTIEKNVDYETEEKIFKLFNEKICKDAKSCMNLSIEAFDSYLKVFLDINMKNSNLKYTQLPRDNSFEIEVSKDPEQLIGFSILWKIVFESLSKDIMNKGIQILHLLFTNVQVMDMSESCSQQLIRKCINLIKDVNSTVDPLISNELKKNIIIKCLFILRLMIEESEKKGTAGLVSHQGLLKKKIITIKVTSSVGLMSDRNFSLKLYGNTSVWDLKQIITQKIKYHTDFLKINLKKGKSAYEITSSDNGKTLLDLQVENGEIQLSSNGLDKQIINVPLEDDKGAPVKTLHDIFNEWFDMFSTNNQMNKEQLAKFVQAVTGNRENVSVEDSRVTGLFKDRDKNGDGFIERVDFVQFYIDSLHPDKRRLVWDNLRCMGVRNDLKKISDPLAPCNEDKTSLPRYQLTNNEEFFNVIFSLQDINEDIAKEAFNFICILSTNPKIYSQILLADGSTDWNTLLSESNIYKLIYSLQIIESFIEDIEINSDKVDNLSIVSTASSDNNIAINKQEWMKNFIQKGGYSHLVAILQHMLKDFIDALSDNSSVSVLPPMTSMCVDFLFKIVKIFYVTSLSKFDSYRKAVNEYKWDKNASSSNEKVFVRGSSFQRSQSCNLNQLEDYFVTEGLSELILASFDHNSTIPAFLSCIDKLILKPENSDDMIMTIFEFVSVMIPYSQNYAQVKEMLITDSTFMKIILYGLLNENEAMRIIFSSSLIKMCKLLQKINEYDVIAFLLKNIFELIENISKDLEKNSFELFEFFSYIMEMFMLNPDQFASINIDSTHFLKTLLDSLHKDINEEAAGENSLSDELFLGFMKIISQVAENNLEIKQMISNNYNLIQGILTKVLFKQSSSEMAEKLAKVDFINPDRISDAKSLRNSSQNIRNVCYRFILSMLKDSIDNFEKFFSVKLIEEKKESEDKTKKETRYFYVSDYPKNEGHVGLKNLGCICYMNATMQQLFMVPSLRYSLLRMTDNLPPNTGNPHEVDDNVLHQIQRMFAFLDLSDRCDYNPFGFTFSFKDFEGAPTKISEQKDAQEFLSICLDRMERQSSNTFGKYAVQSIFGGRTCSQVICDSCGNTSSRYEDTPFLSLEVKNMKTLNDSLEKLISQEKIDEYSCDGCKQKVSITKRNSLFTLPNVLIVHLQRIFYNWEIDRNEKINSKLEFPRTLNMKQYCLEEMVRKNAAGKNKDGDEDPNIETDEIYFKHQSYYEYHLVGVIVHMGCAEAGHYYSFINTVRDGVENEATYNPTDEAHANSWLEFNDSSISKFNASKLEDECFGGAESKEDRGGFAWGKGEKSRSAYMLVYERKIKSPLKVVIDPKDIQVGIDHVVSFKEEEYHKIKKEYDLLRYVGTNEYPAMKMKIFDSVFYDVAKNEYFKYSPFYYSERLIPKQTYLEILEDNSKFRKNQNISDQKFANFFDEAINLLDETLGNLKSINEDTAMKISITFLNFIFNVLSQKDKVSLLKSAKEKCIRIVQSQPACLVPVWRYINDHLKQILDCMINENETIEMVNCELISDLVKELYKADPKKFIEESQKNEFDDTEIYSICMKTISTVFSQFPKIPNKFANKVGPIMKFLREVSLLDENMIVYFGKKELIFKIISFLQGKEGPCYNDTFAQKSEAWDIGFRPVIVGFEPIVDLIYDIFKRSNVLLGSTGNEITLSEKDIKCIKNPMFLKYIFKSCGKAFSSLLITLNTDNAEFTVQSCGEITKSIDEINFYMESNEFVKLSEALLPLFALKDQYQQLRFELVLGLPQFILEDSFKEAFPKMGFHCMRDKVSKYITPNTSYIEKANIKINSSLIKKLYEQQGRRVETVQVFLLLLEACLTNPELYKYLKMMPSEEIWYKDFIEWGVSYMKDYLKLETNPWLVKLGGILQGLDQVAWALTDPTILPGFKGFFGRYLINDIKREEVTVMTSKDNIFVLQVEYFANLLPISETLDFTKSKAYFGPVPPVEEGKKPEEVINENENILTVSEDILLVSSDNKVNTMEKEFFKSIMPHLATKKKIIIQNKFSVPEVKSVLKRFVVLNCSSKDELIEISFKRLAPVEEPNEYFPTSSLGGLIMKNTMKNLYAMGKLNVDKEWTDGNNIDIQVSFETPYRSVATTSAAPTVNSTVYINRTPHAQYQNQGNYYGVSSDGTMNYPDDEDSKEELDDG